MVERIGVGVRFGVWSRGRGGVEVRCQSRAGSGIGGRARGGRVPGVLPHAPICPQPIGALLLEHCRVIHEEPSSFSISECGLGRGCLSPPRRGPT